MVLQLLIVAHLSDFRSLELEENDEDNEDEVQDLLKDAQTAADELEDGSDEQRVLSALLLKVRGFIAKVCNHYSAFFLTVFFFLLFFHFTSTTRKALMGLRYARQHVASGRHLERQRAHLDIV